MANHPNSTLQHADVDYSMMYGQGLDPIPSVTDPTITKNTLGGQFRDPDWASSCKDNRSGTCWIERPITLSHPTKHKRCNQVEEPPGTMETGMHHNSMVHNVTVLRAPYEATTSVDHQTLAVEGRHVARVSTYHDNIKTKVAKIDPEIGLCYGVKDRLPTGICNMPFQARTEFTPSKSKRDKSSKHETSWSHILSRRQPKLNIRLLICITLYLASQNGQVDYLAQSKTARTFALSSTRPPTLRRNRIRIKHRLAKALTVDDNGDYIDLWAGVSQRARLTSATEHTTPFVDAAKTRNAYFTPTMITEGAPATLIYIQWMGHFYAEES
jgi:hypothetical protein